MSVGGEGDTQRDRRPGVRGWHLVWEQPSGHRTIRPPGARSCGFCLFMLGSFWQREGTAHQRVPGQDGHGTVRELLHEGDREECI